MVCLLNECEIDGAVENDIDRFEFESGSRGKAEFVSINLVDAKTIDAYDVTLRYVYSVHTSMVWTTKRRLQVLVRGLPC
jgi:hypothetical protein